METTTPNSPALPVEVDVIVVGAGAAALTGAYTAASHGLEVLVLEKTHLLGGTCAYAGAGLWFPGNDVLSRNGVVDTVEAGLEYFKATVGDRTPVDLHEAYVRTGRELVGFLEQSAAMRFQVLRFPDYFDAPGRARPAGRAICPAPIASALLGDRLDQLRPTMDVDKFGHDADREMLEGGQSLIGQLLIALDRSANVDIRVNTAMESLAFEAVRVSGVRADGQDVRARYGVLLAAGGYECDPVRRRALHGLPTAEWASAPVGSNTGDALDALTSVGAAIDLLDEAWWAPGLLFPNGRAAFIPKIVGGIIVGPDGNRCADESLPYDRLGHALLAEFHRRGPETEFWWIFDSGTAGVPGAPMASVDLDAFRSAGLWHSADTPEALAAAICVPPQALRETIERFNGFAASGSDIDFHRGEDEFEVFFAVGDGPNPALVPIQTAPLHAARVVVSDLGSKGGARVDASGRVLNETGEAVAGLYAAGNSAASIAGHVYPGPGVPIGSGMVFAYLAARAMAGEAANSVGP